MKKRAGKKRISLALGLVLCLLAACVSGGRGAGSFTGPKEVQEKTLIRIAWWGGEQREKVTQRLIEKYQETHSWIEFETYSTDMDYYLDKLSVLASSGRMPDILQMDDSFLADYMKKQALADLRPFVEEGKIRTADVAEDLLDMGYVGESLAGIPLGYVLPAVAVNLTGLKEAGVEEPSKGWAWEEYLALNRRISAATGKESAWTSMGPVEDTELFACWLRQHGSDLLNEQQTGLGYEDDSLLTEYLVMWRDLMDADIAPTPEEQEEMQVLFPGERIFDDGSAGTMCTWSNYLLCEGIGKSGLKLFPLPGNGGACLKASMFFSVSEGSDVKEECAEFIDWVINDERAASILRGERGMPSSLAMQEYLLDYDVPSVQLREMLSYYKEQIKNAEQAVRPQPAGMIELEEVFREVGTAVFYGEISAKEAAKSFRREAERILAPNGISAGAVE